VQRAESEFDPVPFDAEAARVYGRVTAAVVSAGRKPRWRIADLMIAATAIAENLPCSPPTRRLRVPGEAHPQRLRHSSALSQEKH
jgi:predicted nucleic acid-binding protein